MNKFQLLTSLVFTCSAFFSTAQTIPVDLDAPQRMQRDLLFLASDSLKGRLPGTPESDVARDFIANRMVQFGIEPVGPNGYFQEFPVPENATVDYDKTGLLIGRKALVPHVDFYPVAYSGNGEISGKTLSIGYGIVKEDGSYNDYEGKDLAGKIAVLNVSSPDGVHPHSAYAAYHSVNQRLKLAKANGAAAVLLINPEKTASDVPEFFKIRGYTFENRGAAIHEFTEPGEYTVES